MKLHKLVTAGIAALAVYMYVDMPAIAQTREVITVRAKRYRPRIVWSGLDTYGNPTNFNQQEAFILQFNNVNGQPLSGFLSVDRDFYNETWIGRQLTRTGDTYYLCRPAIDGCNSFKD